MTVLVAIPFKGAPELLPRAVESVLGQTVEDIRVVVYGDGDPVPPLPADPRLLIHASRVNRGPYFALQAMLRASPHELFAPIGADDYVDPDHLERMLPAVERTAAVTTGRVWWHAPGKAPYEVGVNYEVGLFRTDRLLAFGGYNPAERVGQDSLLVHLIRLSGPFEASSVPTYHRCRREGSLSTSAATGNHSPYRLQVRARNRAVLRQCERLAHSPAALRAYRERIIPGRTRRELEAEVALLRAEIG